MHRSTHATETSLADMAQNKLRALRDRARTLDDPDGAVSPESWAECARYFVEAGQTGRALEVLAEYFAEYAPRVVRHARDATSPLRLMGEIQLQRGDLDGALAAARAACDHPHRVLADEFLLLRVRAQNGHRESALERIRAIRATVDGPWEMAEQVEREIAGLG